MPGLRHRERRDSIGADRLGENTAGTEAAAGGRVDRVGRIAGQRRFLAAAVGVHGWAAVQQRRRVGMGGMFIDAVDRAELGDAAEIHDQHAVGHVLHDVEVVADEQVGQAELGFQVAEQVQHLRLDGFVEGGDRLVEDDQARAKCQRAGDVDPLPLPARELMRVAPGKLGGVQADRRQQFHRTLARGAGGEPVHDRAEGDRLRNGQARIERGVAVLEYHLHLAAVFLQRQFPRTDSLAVEDDLARRRIHQRHDQAGGRRLAAAGLAHDA